MQAFSNRVLSRGSDIDRSRHMERHPISIQLGVRNCVKDFIGLIEYTESI